MSAHRLGPIALVGMGAWGSVLAAILGRAGHQVTAWTRDRDAADAWMRTRRDPHGRTPVSLPPTVAVSSDLERVVDGASCAFVAVPNAALDTVVRAASDVARGPVAWVSCGKGLMAPGFTRPSTVIARHVGTAPVTVLSGPNLASELARGLPAAATVAGTDDGAVQRVQAAFSGSTLRVYRSRDPLGVEIAGAYKNVIALASGMVDALSLGENVRAALITRGLAEMVRLGAHLGAHERTFYGLAGVGDLIATCASPASRNHRAGVELARGTLADALLAGGLTAEGIGTARTVARQASTAGLDLPIVEQVVAVIDGHRTADDALDRLLRRNPQDEWPSTQPVS